MPYSIQIDDCEILSQPLPVSWWDWLVLDACDSLTPHADVVPSKDGTHNHRRWPWREQAVAEV
ncbi:hypothetical protein ACVJGD_005015 [Bradyrhizobium sp. USDA 10063]